MKLPAILITLLVVTLTAFAQESNNVPQPKIVTCQTMDEIRAAREGGADIIETNGRFFVVNGDKYEGPWVQRENAIEFWQRLQPQKGRTLTESTEEGTRFANPELMLFPFTELSPQTRQPVFLVPGDEIVPASAVMLHAEPFTFAEVGFSPFVLGMPKTPMDRNAHPASQAGGMYGGGMAPGMGMGMGAPPRPRPTKVPPERNFFAVTGSITEKETIEWPLEERNFWVGASVVGQDGVVLWQTYGQVQENGDFACVKRLPTTRVMPQFLLLFLLAKADLETNLRPTEDIPEIDATPYGYHVLASSALEMAPNWLPPLEEVFQEELEKLMQEEGRPGAGQPSDEG